VTPTCCIGDGEFTCTQNSVKSQFPIMISRIPSHLSLSSLAKNISVRAERLRESGRAPSEMSETPQWQITPHPVSIPRVALHIALQSLFLQFFSLCRSCILNKHPGVGANCDHTLEWVHWVHACIWNAMGDVAKISPRVPSTSAQNAVLSLLIIHIIPSRQIYVAINNPSLVPSISCLTTGSYLWN
jgi:hypothetical protein